MLFHFSSRPNISDDKVRYQKTDFIIYHYIKFFKSLKLKIVDLFLVLYLILAIG